MKKITLLITLLCVGFQIKSQEISRHKSFDVSGHDIRSVGYPGKIVSVDQDNIAYVEYWSKDQSGRREADFYLQSYNGALLENWFSPLNKVGTKNQMQYMDLFRMKSKLAVIGKLYNANTKTVDTRAQLYSLEGKPASASSVKISCFDSKAKKGFSESFEQSFDKTKLLWKAQNESAGASKRRYFFTVLGDGGQVIWKKNLTLPHSSEKYYLKQAEIDNKGNLYALMVFEGTTNTLKDTTTNPILLRYDFAEKKFSESPLHFNNSAVSESMFYINQKGELFAAGLMNDGSETGFDNGKHLPNTTTWTKIGCKKFNISRELTETASYTMDMPTQFTNRYQTRGADFSNFEVLADRDHIFWVMEEHYTIKDGKNLKYKFGDIAVIAIGTAEGKISWANFHEKKQFDIGSGNLMSYVSGISKGRLRFVYLDSRGAQGRIIAASFEAKNGTPKTKALITNDDASWLFYPKRSSMINTEEMMLMGIGNPVGNDYKLIKVGF